MTTNDDLGIYYKCFRGMNSHFALTEPESFTVIDAARRDWICFPVPKEVVQNLDLLSDLVDVERADKMAEAETDVRLVFCRDKAELAAKLADESQQVDDEE